MVRGQNFVVTTLAPLPPLPLWGQREHPSRVGSARRAFIHTSKPPSDKQIFDLLEGVGRAKPEGPAYIPLSPSGEARPTPPGSEGGLLTLWRLRRKAPKAPLANKNEVFVTNTNLRFVRRKAHTKG